MMLALGVGGYMAGTFHLTTHAFFKALLFLGAGSVIHAVHTQDIRQMGGLIGKMKVTGITFIVGALALAGILPLSGFWSKDEIFVAVWANGNPVLFGAAVLTSFLTAFYMARVIFMTFFGAPRSEMHAHESPLVMTGPLVVLAVFAAGLGFIASPWWHGSFQNFLTGGKEVLHLNLAMIGFSTILSLSGIGLAYLVIVKGMKLPGCDCPRRAWFIRLVENKYYMDELYDAVLLQPFYKVCAALKQFDSDRVDGAVNGIASLVAAAASVMRRLQTGRVENYLLMQVGGTLLLLVYILGKICRIF
jgi:NADH-quinone oxidoreductase subunit L